MSIPLIVNEPPPFDDDDDAEESDLDGHVDEFHPSGLNLDLNDSPADSPRKIPLSPSPSRGRNRDKVEGAGVDCGPSSNTNDGVKIKIEVQDQNEAVTVINGDGDFKADTSVTVTSSSTIRDENENQNQEDNDNDVMEKSPDSIPTSPIKDPSSQSHNYNPSSNNLSEEPSQIETEPEPPLELEDTSINLEAISIPGSEVSADVNHSQLPVVEQVNEAKLEENVNDNGEIENDDDFAEFESFQEFNNSSVISPVQENEKSKINQSQSQVFDVDDEFGDFSSELPSVNPNNNIISTTTTTIQTDEKVVSCQTEFLDDDDDDFDDFQSNSTVVNDTLPHSASNNITNQQTNQLKSSEPVSQFVSDVDNYQYKSISTNINPVPIPVGNKLNYESLIKSVFTKVDESATTTITSEPNENGEGLQLQPPQLEGKTLVSIDKILEEDKEWLQIKDFEASQSLLFKWINCISYQEYIKSLKVDLNNGNIDVPKFAANLQQCRSPLQPKISIIPLTPTKPTDNHNPTDTRTGTTTGTTTSLDDGDIKDKDAEKAKEILEPSSVSALPCDKFKGQFSSSSEYSSNPNPSQKAIGDRGQFPLPEGADEVQWILNQLPDLSFIRSKTLVLPN